MSNPNLPKDRQQEDSLLSALGAIVMFPIYMAAWLALFVAVGAAVYNALGWIGVVSVGREAVRFSEAVILFVVSQKVLVTFDPDNNEWLRMPPRWEAAVIFVGAVLFIVDT